MVNDQRVSEYHHSTRKSIAIILALTVVTIVLTIYSFSIISVKNIDVSFMESLDIIRKHLEGFVPTDYYSMIKDRMVVETNIPRALTAICAGSTLAVCGATIQSTIRNPLADPYTLGISSGALFGMVLSVGLGISIIPLLDKDSSGIANAFVMSLIPTAVIVLVATFKKITPTMMILCGLGVMYIFTALSTIVKYSVDPEVLSQIYSWSLGSVSGVSFNGVYKLIIATVIAFVSMMVLSGRIDIVGQGDTNSLSLGINPNRLRINCLIISSLCTAVIVCYTGTIGFVGLVAPHIARVLVGSRNRILIPCSAVVGALMILIADCLVRLYLHTLPVGAITALFCSPIFILLLIKMKKNTW